MDIRCGENPQTRSAAIGPFANDEAVGRVAKSEWPTVQPTHPLEKSASSFSDATIHRLSAYSAGQKYGTELVPASGGPHSI
jgi:hypothetical protein